MIEFSVFRLTNKNIPGVFLLSYSTKGLKGVKATVKNYYVQYNVHLKRISNGLPSTKYEFHKLFNENTTLSDIEMTLEKTFSNEADAEAYKKMYQQSPTEPISVQPSTNWETVKSFLHSEIEMLGCDISFSSNEVEILEEKLNEARNKLKLLENRREDIIKLMAVCQPHSH
jgi:hypothetical protein